MDNLTKKCEDKTQRCSFKEINDNIKYLQQQAVMGGDKSLVVQRMITKCDVCSGTDPTQKCYYVGKERMH